MPALARAGRALDHEDLGQDGLPEGWTGELEVLPQVAAVERRDFELVHPVDRATLVALVRSWSNVAALPEPERELVCARVRELWDHDPALGSTSGAALTYRTEAYRVRLSTE